MDSEDELLMPKVTQTTRIEEKKQEVYDEPIEMDQDDDYASDDSMGTAEELTIQLKSKEEREEIEAEIDDLEHAVPQLAEDYKVVDRLGTGTFSSVYKAIDLWYHEKWYNAPWHGHHPPTSSAHYQSAPKPPGSKVFVAIKRIYVTSNPERIRNEISILEDCRGCRHVSQLITAFRRYDQVVVIMPYHRNEDFRDFYRYLPIPGIKAYFRCMFRALRDIHARGVIHRDVKPANFLFDPRTGIGTLCDFGLACRIEPGQTQGTCLHTPATKEHPHGRIRNRGDLDFEMIKRAQKDARMKCSIPSDKVGYPEKDPRPMSKANRAGTRGFRAPEVLLKCNDQTAIDMWAAGTILLFFLTGKFPLFQSNDDVEALMEIACVIGRRKMEKAATLHSRTFSTNVPSISPEGISWREFVEKQNPRLFESREPDSRYFPFYGRPISYSCKNTVPPPASSSPTHDSQQTLSSPTSHRIHRSPSPALPFAHHDTHKADIEDALNLCEQLMHPESTRRITPRAALYHPFLNTGRWMGEGTGQGVREEEEENGVGHPEDDEFVPHPFGQGVCGEGHFRDEVTEEPYVNVAVECECGECDDGSGGGNARKYEALTLTAGEGIAIGRQPCEFHRGEFGV
ncbi:hypothetical protein AMATHDRAFT_145837 [Amanita thiersii Skay4041]|uniref:non-specific serine/threonine protein kinase n=1 Tax=Amanita thiersii Skay4041 TaxID=703135 RepID=A0A2A9NHT8_9AGAR|nr:hypothetical protein AMATHDRAFT_145837 [Amanita thiersii Skay4041]